MHVSIFNLKDTAYYSTNKVSAPISGERQNRCNKSKHRSFNIRRYHIHHHYCHWHNAKRSLCPFSQQHNKCINCKISNMKLLIYPQKVNVLERIDTQIKKQTGKYQFANLNIFKICHVYVETEEDPDGLIHVQVVVLFLGQLTCI